MFFAISKKSGLDFVLSHLLNKLETLVPWLEAVSTIDTSAAQNILENSSDVIGVAFSFDARALCKLTFYLGQNRLYKFLNGRFFRYFLVFHPRSLKKKHFQII